MDLAFMVSLNKIKLLDNFFSVLYVWNMNRYVSIYKHYKISRIKSEFQEILFKISTIRSNQILSSHLKKISSHLLNIFAWQMCSTTENFYNYYSL